MKFIKNSFKLEHKIEEYIDLFVYDYRNEKIITRKLCETTILKEIADGRLCEANFKKIA